MSIDETATILKNLEHIVKVKYSFVVLEEGVLTKAIQLPKPLLKTTYFS